MKTVTETQSQLEELIKTPQFTLGYVKKQTKLLPLLINQIKQACQTLPSLAKYIHNLGLDLETIQSYEELPFLPVSVFKHFKLSTVPDSAITRVLKSSATTTGIPSQIYLDKATALRQRKGVAVTMMSILGKKRKPFLIFDCPEVTASQTDLTARGAAIRGFEPFASNQTFVLEQLPDGQLKLNQERLLEFFEQHQGEEVFAFGFTYIIWLYVIQELKASGISFNHPQITILHSGGWKKLTALQIDKTTFNQGVAETLGCLPAAIRDFYGMVEQVGVVFIDCLAGNKHSPDFAEVLIRDFKTLKQVEIGQQGLIQVMSALPESYPGQALLTEDVGYLMGIDDCPCGQAGLYFRFRSRAEHTEVRGCGDTFASTHVIESQPQSMNKGSQTITPILLPEGGPSVSHKGFFKELAEFWSEPLDLPYQAIIGLLNQATLQMQTEEFRGVEGLAFLTAWLGKKNLEQVLALNLQQPQALNQATEFAGKALRAAPRGIVAHWVAGNVPTLAFFSWALAILTKNASILRVPQHSIEPIQKLFQAVKRAEFKWDGKHYTGSQLLQHTCLLHFASDSLELNEALSLIADSRVIWGGRTAIQSITALPRQEHCEDLVFGPKFSLAVMDRDTLQDSDLRAKTLGRLVKDTIIFDQQACSSPQVLYLESDQLEEGLEILQELDQIFAKTTQNNPLVQLPELATVQILQARAMYGLTENRYIKAPQALSYTLLLDQELELPQALQYRTLFIKLIPDLTLLKTVLSPKVQTIGLAVSNQSKYQELTELAASKGVSRCVPLGSMNWYETPWDGMLPLSRLVRWCRV